MKLIGEVEVFKILSDGTPESVLKESNMVVDGASEVIVDMLTTPYSIKNTTGSASLDPSNFMVNAVTLGKAERLYGGHPDTSAADTDEIGMHAFFNNINLSTIYNTCCLGDSVCDDWYGARQTSTGVSSYIPSVALPKFPNPRDTGLENSSKTQIELYYELSALGTSGIPENTAYTATFGSPSGWDNASALRPSLGHNLNALYGRVNKSTESMFQGCYAPSDGMDIYVFNPNVVRSSVVALGATVGEIILSQVTASANDVSGQYNLVGSMDRDGFLVAYPVQHHPASGDTTYGVAVSAGTTSATASLTGFQASYLSGPASTVFLDSPAVCYDFTVSASDLLALAAYKGVTNIGLWALDAKETFKTEAAPVDWGTPSNNRKYKLFAKKVFSEDLTRIADNTDFPITSTGRAGITSYSNLSIKWRMNFNFGETFGDW